MAFFGARIWLPRRAVASLFSMGVKLPSGACSSGWAIKTLKETCDRQNDELKDNSIDPVSHFSDARGNWDSDKPEYIADDVEEQLCLASFVHDEKDQVIQSRQANGLF